MPGDLSNSQLERFAAVVGQDGLVTDGGELEPHLTEWRGLYHGKTPCMITPANVEEVARVMKICATERIAVVPQGGNTGLVGGAIPHSTPAAPQILLSARRLHAIRNLDAANYTVTAEAGCLLADVQGAAERADRLFPLSLAAEGSCQLGGNISTNAGGTNVLRYGNTRDLVLGLEVVLPDGRLFQGLQGLRKDNTGYDLKQLFIGAEGTLGFITAATCKLFPRSRSVATAMVAVADPEAAIRLHSQARQALGEQLVAFELINPAALQLVLAHIPDTRNPLSDTQSWTVLVELGSAGEGRDAEQRLEGFLAAGMDTGLVIDGALAQTGAHRDAFWRLRHSISEAEKLAGAGIKHDISVPLSRVAEFLRQAEALVVQRIPDVLVVAFGHLGDGNLHFNLNQPPTMAREAFMAHWDSVSQEIHSIAVDLGGSFSAEHGIGTLKRDELGRLTDDIEIDLMRAVKVALDPDGIMNPGKILPIIE
jgi:FAD/FMN-containing dehydrogenase